MTALTFAVAMAALGVNGPEDDGQQPWWDAVDWRAHEENVRRLRQRIFKASQDGGAIVNTCGWCLLRRGWFGVVQWRWWGLWVGDRAADEGTSAALSATWW